MYNTYFKNHENWSFKNGYILELIVEQSIILFSYVQFPLIF